MGDLNYRIDMETEAIKKCIEKNDIESILENDQFLNEQLSGLDIDNFYEGKIDFMPTYKFKLGSNDYDFSERVPSWTDRIIYKSKKNYDLIQLDYKSINEVKCSDHKPVYSVFKILSNEKNIENDNNRECDLNYQFNFPNIYGDTNILNGSPINNKSSVCLIF